MRNDSIGILQYSLKQIRSLSKVSLCTKIHCIDFLTRVARRRKLLHSSACAADWETFWYCRAKELKKGGKFNYIQYAGDGLYGDLMGPQAVPHLKPVKTLLRAVFDSLTPSGTFSIGDYGTADGASSMGLIGELIGMVKRKMGADFPVQVIYEDQCRNDFNTLFKRLHGVIKNPRSYLEDFQNVYTLASGSSFFLQSVPDNTLDVIFSFFACHYLSESATVYQDSLYRFPDSSDEEKKALAKQGAADWETFLYCRAKELKKGGVMLLAIPSEDPEKKYCNFQMTKENVVLGLTSLWRTFRDEGKITQEEFVNTNHKACCRTEAEIRAPFEDPTSPIVKAGLKLVSLDIRAGESYFKQLWRRKLVEDGVDDRKTFGHQVAVINRTWTNVWFLNGLSDSRSAEEKEAILEEFFRRLEDVYAAMEPEDPRWDNIYGYALMKKE